MLYSEHAIYQLTSVFDALVDGEGELALAGLCRHAAGLCALEEVPNLIYQDGADVRRTARVLAPDLDELPDPVYDPAIYPSLEGDEQIKLFVLDESRGCPMGCAFCVHQTASGAGWRVRSPGQVTGQVKGLVSAFGTRAFRLGGSYTPGRFYREFSSLMQGQGVSYCGFGHANGLPRGELEALARSGCRSLFLGVESFNGEDLARMNKRVKPGAARGAVEACVEAGIIPVVALITPLPGQTRAAVQENLAAAAQLCGGGRGVVVTGFPGLLPRTDWWRDRAGFGFELSVPEDSYRRTLLNYKIRHIIPPQLWEPLPYRLDGADFAGYAGANAAFQKELGAAGLVLNMPDEVVMMARLLGEPMEALKKRLQAMLFCLDADETADFVVQINAAMARVGP